MYLRHTFGIGISPIVRYSFAIGEGSMPKTVL